MNVITHQYPNFNVYLVKPRLKLGYVSCLFYVDVITININGDSTNLLIFSESGPVLPKLYQDDTDVFDISLIYLIPWDMHGYCCALFCSSCIISVWDGWAKQQFHNLIVVF